MVNLIIFGLAIASIVLNSYLIEVVPSGTGWQKSPMGMVGSRLIYSRSQVPWHNGVDADFTKNFEALNLGAFPDYFESIYLSTKPDGKIAHPELSTMEELTKNILVVKLMRISLDWDPSNYRTAHDLAFLLQGPVHHSDVALRILNETLAENLPDEGRLLLDIEKFQLLFIMMHRIPEAEQLVPEIEKLTKKCAVSLPDNSDTEMLLKNAEAIPIIVANEKKRDAISPHLSKPNR